MFEIPIYNRLIRDPYPALRVPLSTFWKALLIPYILFVREIEILTVHSILRSRYWQYIIFWESHQITCRNHKRLWTLSFRKQNASCEKLKISWKWKTKKIKEILRTTNSVNSWEIKVHKKWIENKRTKIIIYKVIWPNNLLVITYIYYISITEVKTTQTQVKDLPGIK